MQQHNHMRAFVYVNLLAFKPLIFCFWKLIPSLYSLLIEPNQFLTALFQTAVFHLISFSVQTVSSCMHKHTVKNSFSLVSWRQ